jgi:hypothetical protein
MSSSAHNKARTHTFAAKKLAAKQQALSLITHALPALKLKQASTQAKLHINY